MRTLNQTLTLFAIIIIEGYVVLSTELLAIRLTIPYVGSGTDTISIIIAAVLMPLAFGYQYGGRFKQGKKFGRYISLRRKLMLNILISATILLPGLTYLFLREFFPFLSEIGIQNRLLQTTVYCLLFLVIPVYLLGQTVPLVSNYFAKEHLPKITGKILAFSTVGSFLGAVFSTIVLMSTIGVHHTVTLNFMLLSALIVLLSPKKLSLSFAYSLIVLACALYYNSNHIMGLAHVVKNNEYHMVVAGTLKDGSHALFLNGNHSSLYNRETGNKHDYIEFAERVAIFPILNANPPKEILVIGAGGFTFGHEDTNNTYTFIDIDEDLQKISEEHILGQPLKKNKTFIAEPARAFLNRTDTKFDVIYLDAYHGGMSLPEHLVTQEFFRQLKAHIKDGGLLLTNFGLSPNFKTATSRNVDNTLRSVFPHVSRHAIHESYALWDSRKNNISNIAYIYRHQDTYDQGKIYTDNLNTVFFDKPKKLSE